MTKHLQLSVMSAGESSKCQIGADSNQPTCIILASNTVLCFLQMPFHIRVYLIVPWRPFSCVDTNTML